MTDDDVPGAAASPGALLMALPGRARSRTQALKAFEEDAAALRRRLNPAFWSLLVPEAKDVYRWRVQLECGCINELYTRGKDRYPDESSSLDPITQCRLPSGERWCSNDHGEVQPVYRDIVEWIEPEIKEFSPDPEEPIYAEMDTDTWAKIRHTEPHSSAFWRVRLSCGHFYDHVVTDVGWQPKNGPELASAERTAEMRRELEEAWAKEGQPGWPKEGPERDHVGRMLDLRWPRPEPDQACRTCWYARRISGYQRLGWLVPKSKPAESPSPDAERKKTEARLAKAEAEVRRLREQLSLTPHQPRKLS